jgi:hydroxymethylglutaryl-CoA lyase
MEESTHHISKPVALVECPRDAMQGWKNWIPTGEKTKYLNALLQVGFHTLDFGSFVSPTAIPQMKDTKEVLAGLDLSNTNTKLLAIVANLRGAQDAAAFEQIGFLGFPFSLSPTFQQRNANSTPEEAIKRIDDIQELCLRTGKQLVVYLSMGFGNPYGDAYNEDILRQRTAEMAQKEIKIISLADTVGMATPQQISFALRTLIPQYTDVQFGVHLHAAPHQWKDKLAAAYDAGCTRYDGALKGIGGCPMAADDLVGNMDTEHIIEFLSWKNALPEINGPALANSLQLAEHVFST